MKINEFFATIGNDLAQKIPERLVNPVDIATHPPIFELSHLELLDIATIIRDLSPSASCILFTWDRKYGRLFRRN